MESEYQGWCIVRRGIFLSLLRIGYGLDSEQPDVCPFDGAVVRIVVHDGVRLQPKSLDHAVVSLVLIVRYFG